MPSSAAPYETFVTDLAALGMADVYRRLESSPAGLAFDEVQHRIQRYGTNSLAVSRETSWSLRLLRQLTHFLALLLWIAALLAFIADAMRPGEGMAPLGWAIVGVILLNAGFALWQEYRAERAVASLHHLLPSTAWVVRLGQPQQVPRDEVVPGDVLLLDEGEQVPADARLVEATGLRVDNSALTGEATPKRCTADASRAAHPLDSPNLVFAGTSVLAGHGRAVVYAIGMATEFGRIAHLATTIEPELSPLQKEIVRVTRVIALISLAMGLLVFALGLTMNLGFWISAIFGIGIIAANVPEGLLPTVTLALAMGSQRMAKRKALIKHLPSVETLGCATVICTDKTGTLTENRMRVECLYVNDLVMESREGLLVVKDHLPSTADPRQLGPLIQAMALCHNAKRARQAGGRHAWAGDPTEVALVEFLDDHGVLPHQLPGRMGELPFDADRKRMATLHWISGRLTAYVKGAPESVLPLCSHVGQNDERAPMTADERRKILVQSRAFAQQAYRVLAVAMREIVPDDKRLDIETVEQNLTFLGLLAMMDPPHREVPEAIARCRRAGVRVIMITGDHPLTAEAIARKIGLAPSSPALLPDAFVPVVEGAQVESMSDEALRRLLTPARPGQPEPVFARMAPRHKMRVVSTLKEMGEVVAVTGDGVNDAPALKRADIGIAMGVAGTDVAKDTADMILLDDNFATIVNAIEEGRTVYANIRKFCTYVLSSNVPEIVPYLGYGLVGIPLAITVPQILAVDLGTDIVPALALGSEPPHQSVMDQPPRPRTERLMNGALLLRAYLFLGLLESLVALGAFFWFLHVQGWAWGDPLPWSAPLYKQATAVTLAAIVMSQVANAFACRSDQVSSFRLGLWTNPLLWLGIGVELTLLALIVYSPWGQAVFATESIPFWIWPVLVLGALGLLLAEELRKLVRRRWYPVATGDDGRLPQSERHDPRAFA
ncbi:MAG TPA: cation-transporting P-type ATPase [Nitrospiraceae bacterium]|nr:cation-transporting P-type ATPase [Nitrospiraceae bacterium]